MKNAQGRPDCATQVSRSHGLSRIIAKSPLLFSRAVSRNDSDIRAAVQLNGPARVRETVARDDSAVNAGQDDRRFVRVIERVGSSILSQPLVRFPST
jgi:hypothetical protein